jgi:hypothetical protein
MAYNSTIKVKQKICKSCGRLSYIFSKGRCEDCSRIEDFNKREEKETLKEEDLRGLIEDADALFSRWIRLKYSDKNGMAICYTCGVKKRFQEMQCGHYISRKSYLLRWDERDCRVQCEYCNCHKHGNLAEFGRRLELENPGITEILLEESRIVYKPTREELRAIIAEFTEKLKRFK